ncbi:hypothetical protein ACIQU5_19235 [Streptomyces sp. NPDC090306]|uniref:hypothetical protein n=1 Tax=Streptomyces sp. NPDC090306 TaxID=3365961 RepID=UPI00381CB200
MENGPAAVTGAVFALFGAALLLWTAVCVRQRRPVAAGVHPAFAAAVTGAVSLVSLAVGVWCFAHLFSHL